MRLPWINAYPDVISKAAALLHSLVLYHGFVDGNKHIEIEEADGFLRSRVFSK